MSLSLPSELQVVLCPERVTLLPVRRTLTLRGLLRTLHQPQTIVPIDGATGAQPWRPALLALESALLGAVKAKTAATVVLSNQFLRYALVPWQAGLADSQEDVSYARHCFTKVYGKAALQWELRLSDQAPGRPRLASGVDAELLEGLRSLFARSGISLRAIQPHLMAAFNDARRQLRRQRNSWFALLEPGHLCLALLRDGCWLKVRSLRIDSSWREELPRLLEREAFLTDDPAVPKEVYVGHLEAGDLVPPELDGWKFHPLNTGLASASASAEAGHIAMAMAG